MKFTNELNEFAVNIINTVREPLLVLDKDLRVLKASRSFYNFFKVTSDETIGKLIYDLGNHQWNIPKLRELLETILPEKTTFDDYEVEHDFSTIGKRVMLLNARQIKRGLGKEEIILLAIEDITDRKNKEESLKEDNRMTNEYVDILFNHAHAPIIVWDSSFVITRFNNSFEKLTGYDISEVMGKKIDFLFPANKRESTLKLLENYLGEEIFEINEIDILRKDKEIRTVLWNSANVFDKDGRIIIATVAQDITERKHAEEKIRNLAEFPSENPFPILRVAKNGTLLYVNESGKKQLPEWNLQIEHSVPNMLKEVVLNTLNNGEIQQVEFNQSEKTYLFYVTPIFGTEYANLYGWNITERKLAEDELLASKLFIEEIINSIPVRVFWKDKNLIFLGCNTIFANDAGFSNPREIIGKDDYQMGWRDQAELYRDDDRIVIESGKSKLLIEEPQTTPEGKTITLLTSKLPLRDSKGEIIGLLGTYIDITERKQAEKKLQESEELFRITAENLTDVIYDWDIRENIDWYGDIDGITGYPPGGFPRTFEAWAATVHPEDKDRVMAALDDHLKGVATYLIEYRVRRKDGEWRWWSARGTALRDDRGEPYKMIGSITDISERKLSIDALCTSEAKFRSYVNDSPQGIFVVNAKGQYIDANNAALNQIGCSKEYLLQKTIADILPKEDLEKGLNHFNILLKEGKSTTEIGLLKTNGEKIYVILDTVKISDDNFLSFSTDITARKRSDEELRESEEKYRSFFENSMDSILLTSPDGRIFSANPAACKMFGYSEKEIIRLGKSGIADMTDPQLPILLAERALNGKVRGELKFIRKDGTQFIADISSAIFKNQEGLDRTNMIISDITERKQAEEKIMALSRFPSENPNPILRVERDGKINYANAASGALLRMWKCSEFEYLPPDWRERVVNSLRHNIQTTVDVECQERFYSILVVPILDAGYVNLYGRDITKRKRAEKELIEAKEKAEEMNRLKSNFLANMSHELRTPLVGILGYAGFLRQDAESEEKREMAETIFNSGTRLSETLNLILDLSRLETEKTGIKYQKLDIVSKAKEIITLFNETANKKGLSLKSSFSQDSIIINFEERTFHSILNNLINNAIKFTSEGSVTIAISLNNDFVEIKVIDTGIGIAEIDYKTIFEEFRQVSEGYNRNFEGSGLGLSITKKLVEKFGGTVTVESEIGKGSTFKVILPVINTEEREKELTTKEIIIVPKSPKLNSVKPLALVVDDDPFVFAVLKRYTSEYIELDSTVDAEFAFKKLKKKQYDLIFMDINLRRGMDGKEVTKKIRTMKGYESIPIIATTAFAMLGDKEEFLAAGCTHYLSKPFSQEEIVSLLEKVLKLV